MANRLSAAQIRRRFQEFFEARGHTRVPSSSLVPQNDPTLLFVNAGMVQFKDVFTGREKRPYVRAVSVQRCLRAGGKHNDLDNVGFTPRHQTLFEMLGNFSFGDYFKKEAIEWGWELLIDELGLDPKRLAVTVFSGEGEDAPPDEEAAQLWAERLPRDRIYRVDAKDNFWAMGDTGPCGPNSEISIYRHGDAPGHADQPGRGPACDEDDYLELWNLVFMQYEKHPDGSMTKLPKPGVDTGAGLERVASAVAGFESNYETDLLRPLCEEAQRLAGVRSPPDPAPFQVIADHAKATAFLIADGVFPDKGGRSYVLRRIMRRAIRHGTEVGLDEPFFHSVCSKVVELFGEAYPELPARAATIDEVVRAEEDAFRRTLDRGLRRLRVAMTDARGAKSFDPAVAADLYDTYGFPLDLTAVIVAEHGLTLDEAAAEVALKARQGADGGRGADIGTGAAIDDLYFQLRASVGDTEFLGYDTTAADATIGAIIVHGERREQAVAGTEVSVVVDRSPMYAESGGQIGDTGQMRTDGVVIEVTNTIKPVGGMHVHVGRVTKGNVKVGQLIRVEVDDARRDAIRRNHSATHLLHLALREELGDHVVQKGSLVAPDRLRFDFSHNRALTPQQRRSIEARVNALILDNESTVTEEMSPEAAREAGAIGLFGEKYGDAVRVVRIGQESLELCGGTHVRRAGDIGLLAIVGEGSIAQGVRRIEAVTGMGAVEYLQGLWGVASEAMAQLHAGSPENIPERIDRLQAEVKAQAREIERLTQKLATGGGSAADEVVEVEGIKLLTRRVAVSDPKALRTAADALRNRLGSGVVVLGAEQSGKATLLVAVTQDLKARVHAGKLVGVLAGHVDGRGGGRPDLAQAGGPKLAGLDDALGAAGEALGAQLRS